MVWKQMLIIDNLSTANDMFCITQTHMISLLTCLKPGCYDWTDYNLFQRSPPCAEYDIGCGLQADFVRHSIPNRKEDPDDLPLPLIPSNPQLLHQAVASAVSNGVIVSDRFLLPYKLANLYSNGRVNHITY